MRTGFFLLCLVLFGVLHYFLEPTNEFEIRNSNKVTVNDTIKDTLKPKQEFVRINNLPHNFDTVPGGNNVFRSSQPSISQLRDILNSYDINVVIRMNAEEGTGVSTSSEKQLVESMGKKYVWVNAHLGYVKGKGYTKSLDTLQPYLHNGNVLIHCAHGADRTGYQVAKYIQDNLGWDRKELWYYTIKYNNWEKSIPRGETGYIKYMEAFYPYDLWKQEIK